MLIKRTSCNSLTSLFSFHLLTVQRSLPLQRHRFSHELDPFRQTQASCQLSQQHLPMCQRAKGPNVLCAGRREQHLLGRTSVVQRHVSPSCVVLRSRPHQTFFLEQNRMGFADGAQNDIFVQPGSSKKFLFPRVRLESFLNDPVFSRLLNTETARSTVGKRRTPKHL